MHGWTCTDMLIYTITDTVVRIAIERKEKSNQNTCAQQGRVLFRRKVFTIIRGAQCNLPASAACSLRNIFHRADSICQLLKSSSVETRIMLADSDSLGVNHFRWRMHHVTGTQIPLDRSGLRPLDCMLHVANRTKISLLKPAHAVRFLRSNIALSCGIRKVLHAFQHVAVCEPLWRCGLHGYPLQQMRGFRFQQRLHLQKPMVISDNRYVRCCPSTKYHVQLQQTTIAAAM